MERKVGEVIQVKGREFIVTKAPVPGTCKGCDLKRGCPTGIFGYCSSYFRDDDTDVIFKEINKEGEREMKTEKKYIKLGEPYIEDEVIKVVVEDQSHRCEEFSYPTKLCGIEFASSDGFSLQSSGSPELWDSNMVYVRGCAESRDNDPLGFTSLDTYNAFVKAVEEYNEYFSKPQVKEVTMADLEKLLGYPVKIKKED